LYFNLKRLSSGALLWGTLIRLKKRTKQFFLVLLLNAYLLFQPLTSSAVFFFTGDTSTPHDPKLHPSYFYFHPFVQSFSGFEPHFDLFKYFFHLKSQPSKKDLAVVGGTDLQLRQGKEKFYIPYKLPGKVIDLKEK